MTAKGILLGRNLFHYSLNAFYLLLLPSAPNHPNSKFFLNPIKPSSFPLTVLSLPGVHSRNQIALLLFVCISLPSACKLLEGLSFLSLPPGALQGSWKSMDNESIFLNE